MKCNGFVWLGAAMLWCVGAAAAEPACEGAEYRQFDFWLGSWHVHMADGRKAGENRISREEQGCVLVERWQGIEGGTGRSYNFYDPVAAAWRQVWVSPGAIIDISGGFSQGAMVLEGHIVYTGSGERRAFRGTWTPLADGRVRQYFEEVRDDAGWQPWFEGFYSRQAAVDNAGGL